MFTHSMKSIERLHTPSCFGAAMLLLWGVSACSAQGTEEDYERAMNLGKVIANKVYKDRVRPNWLSDSAAFWYRNDLPDQRREFILVDVEAGARRKAFNHKRLANALTEATGEPTRAGRLPIDRIRFSDSRNELMFACRGKRWTCDLRTYEIKEAQPGEQDGRSLPALSGPQRSRRTGEETFVTFINRTKTSVEVYWINTEGRRQHYTTIEPGDQHRQHTYAGHAWLVTDTEGEPRATFVATEDPADAIIDGSAPKPPRSRRDGPRDRAQRSQSPDGAWAALIKDHNVYVKNNETEKEIKLSSDGTEDDPYSDRFYWSPDSKKLVTLQIHQVEERQIHMIESSPDDQLQPKLHTQTYVKPGDDRPRPRPRLFNVPERSQIDVSDELIPNPWSLSDIRWSPDSSRFTFLYNRRGHQVLQILAVDATTGGVTVIVDEQSESFIDYAGKRFSHYLDETNEIIWMSERDGWNHLYLYDAETGELKNQITKGRWVVRGVERVDEDERQIWFRAGSIVSDQDPYYVHLCRINLDGSALTILTEGDGTHEVTFSPDRRFFIDRWSRVDLPPVTQLREARDGSLICELERADHSELLKTGWREPERFVAKGRDGKTDIYGIIIRPGNFDPNRKYPVIEQIYAGPHGAFVPKSFTLATTLHAMAELGFILVQIDGMGTSHRSKAFHDVCWKNLGDSGFPDRILWMKAAAERYPYIDISRVGIYGGSAGGQSALRALLAFGNFYDVAVSDCGCHDNRMDKIWWNELWMGWPVGPHYAEQSNVTQAHNLTGKLLLTVGELDRNVDPASTMQVVDALIKANRDFDLLIVPGRGHGVGETPYAARRRMDFFVRHLLNVEPPDRNQAN